jgi:hypothetical protein
MTHVFSKFETETPSVAIRKTVHWKQAICSQARYKPVVVNRTFCVSTAVPVMHLTVTNLLSFLRNTWVQSRIYTRICPTGFPTKILYSLFISAIPSTAPCK